MRLQGYSDSNDLETKRGGRKFGGETADVVEDAGCTDADIRVHCWGRGMHVRGRWGPDALLGKTRAESRTMKLHGMAFLTLLACGSVWSAEEPTPLNERVVEFARSRMGQRVGDGQCSTLVAEALRNAGARPTGRGRSWGKELPSLRDAHPGDILQFEDAVFLRRRVRPDGALVTLTYKYPHHTAIIAGIRKRGSGVLMTVLHQNAGIEGGDEDELKVVQQWTINLAEMKGGTVKAYRPVAE
jgi:hypothetical protein